MPIYEQDTQDSGPETKYPTISGSGAEKVKLPPETAVSLRITVQGVWEFNLHGNAGWQICPDQTEYNPPLAVTRIILVDSTGSVLTRKIACDLSGNGYTARLDNKFLYQRKVEMYLKTNEEHEMHVTKVYLNTDLTTATNIVFLS